MFWKVIMHTISLWRSKSLIFTTWIWCSGSERFSTIKYTWMAVVQMTTLNDAWCISWLLRVKIKLKDFTVLRRISPKHDVHSLNFRNTVLENISDKKSKAEIIYLCYIPRCSMFNRRATTSTLLPSPHTHNDLFIVLECSSNYRQLN